MSSAFDQMGNSQFQNQLASQMGGMGGMGYGLHAQNIGMLGLYNPRKTRLSTTEKMQLEVSDWLKDWDK